MIIRSSQDNNLKEPARLILIRKEAIKTSRRIKSSFAIMLVATLCVILGFINIGTANAVTIDFTTFPNGAPIPNETRVIDQFKPLGVIFQPLFSNSPRVLTALGGILISGGSTGFFGDIEMEFIVPTTFVTVEVIGSGLSISAEMEAFNADGTSLGTVFHTYTGATGQLSPFTFFTPPGETIASVRYNGGLNPNAASSIGTLIFQPVTEPSTLFLLGTCLVGLLGYGWRRKQREYRVKARRWGESLMPLPDAASNKSMQATPYSFCS